MQRAGPPTGNGTWPARARRTRISFGQGSTTETGLTNTASQIRTQPLPHGLQRIGHPRAPEGRRQATHSAGPDPGSASAAFRRCPGSTARVTTAAGRPAFESMPDG